MLMILIKIMIMIVSLSLLLSFEKCSAARKVVRLATGVDGGYQ